MRNRRPYVPQTESRRQVSNAVNVPGEGHVSKAWLLAALIVCGTMGVGHAQGAQSSASTDPSLALPTAEGFPLHDSSVTFAYLDDLRREVASRRLVQAPRDPDTLRLLVSLRRWDDVLAILEGIADAPAPVIAAHLEALGFEARQMLSDKARNYGARLRTVVAAIGPRPSTRWPSPTWGSASGTSDTSPASHGPFPVR